MPGFVLDASVALAAVLPGEVAAPDARSIIALMPADSAFVPAHWHLEIGNTVLVQTRRLRLLTADADRTRETLRSLPVIVDAETRIREFLPEVQELVGDMGLITIRPVELLAPAVGRR